MKTVFLLSLILAFVFSQAPGTPQDQVSFQFGPIKFDSSVPTNNLQTQQTGMNQNVNTQQNGQVNFSFGADPATGNIQIGATIPDPATMQGFPQERIMDGKYRQRNPNQGPEEIPDELIAFFAAIYGIVGIFACCICCGLTYFCVKKNNQRQRIKDRMQQVQIMFAQSQNMNVLQMSNQPNFPKTVHI